MIKLTSNLVNETIVLQPAFQHMLPDKERMGDLMDTAVNNFYVVGRKWIGKQVRKQARMKSLKALRNSSPSLAIHLYVVQGETLVLGQCLRSRQFFQ